MEMTHGSDSMQSAGECRDIGVPWVQPACYMKMGPCVLSESARGRAHALYRTVLVWRTKPRKVGPG